MDSLYDVKLFAGFDLDEHRAFESAFNYQRVGEGHVFIAIGEVNTSIFVVGSGTVRVMGEGMDGPVEIVKLGPGRIFGEMSFMDASRTVASVEAVGNTEVFELSRDALDRLLAERPDLWGRFWRNLALDLKARLVETNELLEYHLDVNDLLTRNHSFREIYAGL